MSVHGSSFYWSIFSYFHKWAFTSMLSIITNGMRPCGSRVLHEGVVKNMRWQYALCVSSKVRAHIYARTHIRTHIHTHTVVWNSAVRLGSATSVGALLFFSVQFVLVQSFNRLSTLSDCVVCSSAFCVCSVFCLIFAKLCKQQLNAYLALRRTSIIIRNSWFRSRLSKSFRLGIILYTDGLEITSHVSSTSSMQLHASECFCYAGSCHSNFRRWIHIEHDRPKYREVSLCW